MFLVGENIFGDTLSRTIMRINSRRSTAYLFNIHCENEIILNLFFQGVVFAKAEKSMFTRRNPRNRNADMGSNVL